MTAIVLCVLLSQEPAEASPQAQAPAPEENRTEEIDKAFAEETPRRVRLTLTDGRVLTGKLLLRDDMQMLVMTDAGEPVKVDVEQVRRYEEPLPNRLRSRYLFGGSALLPEVGQITLSQIEVFATIFEVGVSEHFSFQLGGALPAYFLGAQGVNAYAAVKAGTSVAKYVHLAVELKLLALGYLEKLAGVSSSVPAAALAEVTGTFGSEDLNVSVSVGPPFNFAEVGSPTGQVVGLPLFTFSAFARVHNNVGLVTENWFVPNVNGTQRWFIADTLGARFFADRWAVDVGLLVMPTQVSQSGPVPPVLPWLNFSYHF
jgi:hypothetical protein